MFPKPTPLTRGRLNMAACSSGLRRRWLFTLSLVTVLAVIAVGLLLWQAVELTSLASLSERVNRAKPFLSGLRLTLIGVLAVLWPWLSSLWVGTGANHQIIQARRMALRWRVVSWLLVIEFVIGQNLFGRFVNVMAS